MCDDSFSDNSANAICREMGYSGSSSWVSGSEYSYGYIQEILDVILVSVECRSKAWNSCSSSRTSKWRKCGHNTDVFLTCVAGKTIISSCFK